MKRWSIVLGLVALAIWPLVHRAGVAQYGFHPWKFFGLAMYATPAPLVPVALFTVGDGGLVLLDERTLPLSARAALARYRVERTHLGRLASPDALAKQVFASRSELDSLVVVVQAFSLDRKTARMVSTRVPHPYTRDETAGGP